MGFLNKLKEKTGLDPALGERIKELVTTSLQDNIDLKIDLELGKNEEKISSSEEGEDEEIELTEEEQQLAEYIKDQIMDSCGDEIKGAVHQQVMDEIGPKLNNPIAKKAGEFALEKALDAAWDKVGDKLQEKIEAKMLKMKKEKHLKVSFSQS